MITEKQKKKLSELIQQYNHLYQNEPDLKKYSEYAITYHSTAIEGSTLTENEVIELLDIGKPAKKREFLHNLMVFDQGCIPNGMRGKKHLSIFYRATHP